VAIENGYIQQEIEQAAYRTQQAVDSGAEVVVGINKFADNDGHGAHAGVFRVDPDVEGRQIDRVRAVRAGRSASEWKAALDDIENAARGTDNLVPRIIAAVEKRATLGEIADAMRRVFGEYEGAGR